MLIDQAFGVHPQMLNLRLERSKILASNIVNADTPGYQARDIDFASIVARMETEASPVTHYDVGYRVPTQASADKNTVELSAEQARFAQNSMDYQTSLTFLKMKIAGLKQAIDGR